MYPDEHIQTLRQPRQIARLLEQLHAERGQLTLVTDSGRLEKVANLLSVDSGRRIMVIDAFDGAEGAVFERAGGILVKTVIDRIQTWFNLPGVTRLHERGDYYYHLPFPDVLYRLQRRGAFRVRPPAGLHAQALMQTPCRRRTLRGLIHDISVTGVCFRFSREEIGYFAVGVCFDHVQILCDCHLDVHVRVEVVNLREEGEQSILVGMRFVDLPPDAERAIDRVVQSIQREMLVMP
ncbi:MAG: flagellar brake protein [Gammaproteobacteria bacterium]|nr:flagellar brake protein [Gammaproteobacteria bacterium]